MKLKESIPSNSYKIIDLYNKIDSGLLKISPDFQRKLVWKKQHKFAFIQTILFNYPFPEVYIASAEMDVEKLQALEIVVDGQQRLSTIIDYIKGRGDFKGQNKILSFDELSLEEKKDFLNYSVTVKDMKNIGMENIKEIFRRINSTDYSLNANEIINAQYGDGEFAIFCKQLGDSEYKVSENETDIIIDLPARNKINNFLKNNRVFSDNDVKRMFDTQYIMLIASTILEGVYFSRSTKINFYLEKYNIEFDIYEDVLAKIVKSIEALEKLKFSKESYWFNKANLFTLIIELSKIDISKVDFELLEVKLLDLENKVDVYFNGDENDIALLTNDETRYFEYARQGSHEFAAREHRGKVIRNIIQISMISNSTMSDVRLIDYLQKNEISYATIIPTPTGIGKNIMDATSKVRDFLKINGIHDYDNQKFGPNHKLKIRGAFIMDNDNTKDTEISLYRSNGRGDYRIWFSSLKEFAEAGNILILLFKDGEIKILNSSKFDYTNSNIIQN